MTERLSTTQNCGGKRRLHPTDAVFIQVSASDDKTVFDVMAKVDASADWTVIDTLSSVEKIGRYAAAPFMMIAVRDNTPGNQAKAWTSL